MNALYSKHLLSDLSNPSIIIWGINPVSEFLMACPDAIKGIYILPSFGRKKRQEELLALSQKKGISPNVVQDFKSLVVPPDAVHQGISALVYPVWETSISTLLDSIEGENPLFLLCDQVSDPQNLGAIIRSASSFGVDALIVTKRNSAPVTGTVVKASSGAIAYIKICKIGNLSQTMLLLQKKGFVMVGLTPEATKNIWDVAFTGSVGLVLGAEGKGLRHLVKNTCDVLARIPLSSKASSLNVATAAGVALYEATRQRRQNLC